MFHRCQDPPGVATSMPSPAKLHHIHISSDEHHDEIVEYYKILLNAVVVRIIPEGYTFLSFDDHDHRVVIIKRDGADPKSSSAIGAPTSRSATPAWES